MHEEGYEEHILYRGYERIDLRTVVVEHILVDMRKPRSCSVARTCSIVVVDGRAVVVVGIDFDEYFELALEGSSLINQSSSLRDPFVLVEYAEHAKLDEND